MKTITLTAAQWLLIYSLFKNFKGIEVHGAKRAIKKYFTGNNIDITDPNVTDVSVDIAIRHAETMYNAVGQMAFSEEVENLLNAIIDQIEE